MRRRGRRPRDRHGRNAQTDGLVAAAQVHWVLNEAKVSLVVTGAAREVGRDGGNDQVPAAGQPVGASEDELAIVVGDSLDAGSRSIGDRDLDPWLRRVDLVVVGAVAVLVPVHQDRQGAVLDLGSAAGEPATSAAPESAVRVRTTKAALCRRLVQHGSSLRRCGPRAQDG